ncbi:hypothetical protein MRX96_012518 [Rhipicephalus microplus]
MKRHLSAPARIVSITPRRSRSPAAVADVYVRWRGSASRWLIRRERRGSISSVDDGCCGLTWEDGGAASAKVNAALRQASVHRRRRHSTRKENALGRNRGCPGATKMENRSRVSLWSVARACFVHAVHA